MAKAGRMAAPKENIFIRALDSSLASIPFFGLISASIQAKSHKSLQCAPTKSAPFSENISPSWLPVRHSGWVQPQKPNQVCLALEFSGAPIDCFARTGNGSRPLSVGDSCSSSIVVEIKTTQDVTRYA